MMNELFKHAKEFASALRRFKYEPVGDGSVLFPEQRVFARGLYGHRVNGGEWVYDSNLLPTEGLNYVLDSFVSSHAAIPLYLSLYAGVIAPSANWVQSTYPSTTSEVPGAPNGYSESVRQTWTGATATAATKDNYAAVAAFTIVTTGSLNVNGVGLHTNSTKSGTTGSLISATQFAAQRTFADTDIFNVKYRLALTSS